MVKAAHKKIVSEALEQTEKLKRILKRREPAGRLRWSASRLCRCLFKRDDGPTDV